MKFTVQSMTIDHYDDVCAMWRQCEGLGEVESREEIAAYLQRNPGLSPVAVAEDGAVVGAVLAGHDGRRGYLAHLGVAPRARGEGVARMLVEYALTRLAALGIGRCSVHVYVENQAAAEYWLHAGWRRRDDLHVFAIDM